VNTLVSPTVSIPEDVMEAMGALVDTGDLAPQQLAFVASAKADVTSDIVHGIRNMQTLRGSHPDAFAKAVNHLLTSTQHRSFHPFFLQKKMILSPPLCAIAIHELSSIIGFRPNREGD
jgi:hypothetical protein